MTGFWGALAAGVARLPFGVSARLLPPAPEPPSQNLPAEAERPNPRLAGGLPSVSAQAERLAPFLRDAGVRPGVAQVWAAPLADAMARHNITGRLRMVPFLANVLHETGMLTRLSEDLEHYKPETLVRLWPKRFVDLGVAKSYVGNPVALGEKLYGGRGGNDTPGDGFKYRGRGPIQVTFKANYRAASERVGVDFVARPDLMTDPRAGSLAAAAHWASAGCNAMADESAHLKIRAVLNTGNPDMSEEKVIGWGDVKALTAKLTALASGNL